VSPSTTAKFMRVSAESEPAALSIKRMPREQIVADKRSIKSPQPEVA
jgi:hypothetical protein